MQDKETVEALETLINEESTFKEVVSAVFESIDLDKSGLIEFNEASIFISSIWKEMGIGTPSKREVENIFSEIDKDKSGCIDKEELGIFLKVLLRQLIEQLKNAIDDY